MDKDLLKEDIEKLPFMDGNLDLEKRVEDLLGRLTLEEKFKICSGTRLFYTKKIKRLNLPKFKMTDGPHGVGALGTFFIKKLLTSQLLFVGLPLGTLSYLSNSE